MYNIARLYLHDLGGIRLHESAYYSLLEMTASCGGSGCCQSCPILRRMTLYVFKNCLSQGYHEVGSRRRGGG